MKKGGNLMALIIDQMLPMFNLTMNNGRRIDCPLCGEEGHGKRTISVSDNGLGFYCFRCGASGNNIHFYGAAKYKFTKPYIESHPDVKEKLRAEISGGKSDLRTNTAFRPIEFKKKDVPIADINERDNTYRMLLSKLQLSNAHRANLLERGLRDIDLYNNGYASTPKLGFTRIPSDLRKDACDLLGVPGFYKKNDTWCLQKTKPGFFVPAKDINGKIQGMQIRFDVVNENDVRYKWLSTRDMESGCAAETYLHFAGYPTNTILITEGPLKADIIFRFLGIPTIAVPGVNSTKHLERQLGLLWQVGVRRIRTAFDMDYITNVNVQESYIKLVKMLQEYGYVVERLKWDENYKGLDDWLLKVHKDKNGKG